MERDKFLSAVEAKEFGIIDKILSHPETESKKEN
jgi:ATP-dependent protease ClpP protease subunit